ncbi:MAG: TetR/AcrR family transcriptional regulator [Nitriliruptorales bacterium]
MTSRTQRTRAPRGEGERLRDEILAAARRLLLEAGDKDAVSIRQVATEVGCTPPSIYLHFGDKDELFFAVCEAEFSSFDRTMDAAVEGIEDPVERLRARGEAYVHFGLENPEVYRILFMHKPSEWPEEAHTEEVLAEAGFGDLVVDVQQCIESGVIAESDTFLVATSLWTMVHGLTSLLIAKPDFPWPDRQRLTALVLETALRGLLVAPEQRQ